MIQITHVCQLLLAFSAIAMMCMAPPAGADSHPGTTEHFKEIFMGRCYDYKQIRYKSVSSRVSTDCETLYQKLVNAFSNKGPCDVKLSDYQPFMDAAKQAVPKDKTLLWSGTNSLASDYSSEGENYVTLGDTLIGYLMDGMVWCGQKRSPGINYNSCPSWDECPKNASEAFWGSASKVFAESAVGEVSLLVNVSNADRPAYRTGSFFQKYELPNLKTRLVTRVTVLLSRPLDSSRGETCTTGSLVQLKRDVRARGLSFRCVDDSEAILHLLCVGDPSSGPCKLAKQHIFRRRSVRTEASRHPRAFNSR